MSQKILDETQDADKRSSSSNGQNDTFTRSTSIRTKESNNHWPWLPELADVQTRIYTLHMSKSSKVHCTGIGLPKPVQFSKVPINKKIIQLHKRCNIGMH